MKSPPRCRVASPYQLPATAMKRSTGSGRTRRSTARRFHSRAAQASAVSPTRPTPTGPLASIASPRQRASPNPASRPCGSCSASTSATCAPVTAATSVMSTRPLPASSMNCGVVTSTSPAKRPTSHPPQRAPARQTRRTTSAAATAEGPRSMRGETSRPVSRAPSTTSQWKSGGFDGTTLPFQRGSTQSPVSSIARATSASRASPPT